MTKNELQSLKPGDSIVNKNPYPGEGQYMIAEVDPPLHEGLIKVIQTLCEKYPGLNGQCSYIWKDAILKSYEIVQ